MQKSHNATHCKHCQARMNSIFCDIQEEDIEALNTNKGCSYYKKGQILFSQDTTPHGLYVIYSGKVKVFQLAENGKEQILRMTKPGDIIGYRALISNDKYTASAETIEESYMCFLPKELFFGILQRNESITQKVIHVLSSDLKSAEHRVTGLAQKPVR